MTLLEAYLRTVARKEEMYPLTISEIADAQRADKVLRKMFKKKLDKPQSQQYQVSIKEDIKVLTDGHLKLVIPRPLRMRAVKWYHHYLQHPGHTRLEETLRASMTWPALCDMVCIRCELAPDLDSP